MGCVSEAIADEICRRDGGGHGLCDQQNHEGQAFLCSLYLSSLLTLFPPLKKKKKKSCLGTGKMLQRKKMKNKRCHSANFFFNVWHKADMGFQWIQKNQLYFPCNLLFFLPDSAEVESRHLVSYE